MSPQVFDNGVLHTGDALALLAELSAGSVDMVLTDPPYSSGGLHLPARQTAPSLKYQLAGAQKRYPPMLGDLKDQRAFVMWAALWLGECWRLAKPGASCTIACFLLAPLHISHLPASLKAKSALSEKTICGKGASAWALFRFGIGW